MENPALFAASVMILLIMPDPTNTLLATSGLPSDSDVHRHCC
jgi:hypothetical protein